MAGSTTKFQNFSLENLSTVCMPMYRTVVPYSDNFCSPIGGWISKIQSNGGLKKMAGSTTKFQNFSLENLAMHANVSDSCPILRQFLFPNRRMDFKNSQSVKWRAKKIAGSKNGGLYNKVSKFFIRKLGYACQCIGQLSHTPTIFVPAGGFQKFSHEK